MGFVVKQLGQARDNDTSAHSIYSPASGVQATVRLIEICNTTGTAANISIFHDDNGTTYDQSTSLMYQQSIPANTTIQKTGQYGMDDPTGNFAYQQGTANAITVTIYGSEKTT